MKLRIATRPSKLAVIQAELLADQLLKIGIEAEIIKVVTEGDEGKFDISRKSAFTLRLEEFLLKEKADVAVHSLKDLPSERPEGLQISFPIADDPADCLVANDNYASLFDVKSGATIGTSSLRRKALLKLYRPDLNVLDLKGNVDTRLKKLREGLYDAEILSCAALKRLKEEYNTVRLSPEFFVPAPGQGIIAVEFLSKRKEIEEILTNIADKDVVLRARIEMEFNKLMEGGCHFPAGIYTIITENKLRIKGYYSDGIKHVFAEVQSEKESYEEAVKELVRLLKGR